MLHSLSVMSVESAHHAGEGEVEPGPPAEMLRSRSVMAKERMPPMMMQHRAPVEAVPRAPGAEQ